MMKKCIKSLKKVMNMCIVGVLVASSTVTGKVYAEQTTEQTQEITYIDMVVDSELDDWKAMEGRNAEDNSVEEWNIAKSEDGSMLYFYCTGTASTQWDGSYLWYNITFKNGETSMAFPLGQLKDMWTVPGAEVSIVCNARMRSGKYVVEAALPMSADDCEITFAGTTIALNDVPVFVPAEYHEPVYEGIIVDGEYDDWDAVTKYEAECSNEWHNYQCLSSVACVYDGDYVYLYIKDGKDGCAAGAGKFSNGRFAIVTDMGRSLVFQINTDNGGSVSGIKGATAKYFGDEWEIAVPASELPLYKESFTFGLYQQEPFIKDIVNLQEDEGTAGEFSGIVYDGLYGDWDSYPHTLIQYTTAGTQTNKPDGEGALYMENGILYGHVASSLDAHLAQKGGEFASAVTIFFNGNYDYNWDMTSNLYPTLVAVDENGNINWSPKTSQLENGNYEFFIADARSQLNKNDITNVEQLPEYEKFFGKMTVTVGNTHDETEFYIDLEQVAKYLSHYSGKDIQAEDFKVLEAQFGKIGSDLLVIAGTSSGPYLGIAVSIITVVVVLKRRNKKIKVVQ